MSRKIWKEEFDDIDSLITIAEGYSDWKEVKEYLRKIYENAGCQIQKVRDFLIVSEELGLIQNNYIDIMQKEEPKSVLSLFAICLYRWGSDLIKQVDKLTDIDEIKKVMAFAELSFKSSLICDPYCFTSYYGVVYCCMRFNDKNKARHYYTDFICAVERLKNINPSLLNYFQLASKEDEDTVEELKKWLSSMINEI